MMRAENSEQSEEALGFKNTADYEPDALSRASTLFEKYHHTFQENRKENEGFRVRVKVGEVELEGEVKVPEVRYQRSGGRAKREPKAVTLQQLQEALVGYDEELEIKEEDGFLLVNTKKFLDNLWDPINQAIAGVAGGGAWVRKENSPTGKGHWRIKKGGS